MAFQYVFSFFIMIVIAAIIFQWTYALLDKLPDNMGNNLWVLTAFIVIPIVLILVNNPDFFKIHTNHNGIPFH